MDDLLSRLLPGILDCLQCRLAVTEDSGRSHSRMGCSPVSESDLADVNGVQDPNQLGGMYGPSIHGPQPALVCCRLFPVSHSAAISRTIERLGTQPRIR